MSRYVALLRGINVGGRNLIRMTDLRSCFEDHGYREVSTYIQSGNVLFGSKGAGAPELEARIEEMLRASFDYQATVVIRSSRQMRATVEGAPRGFGSDPARFRCDVVFLKPSVTGKAALALAPTRDGVDRVWAGRGVLYFERLAARAAQSRLSKITSLPIYRHMTIRNWRTTTELARLLGES